VAGIAQYLSNFIRHNEQDPRSSLFLYGVDMMQPGEVQNIPTELIRDAQRFRLLARTISYPAIGDVIKTAETVDDVRAAYEPVIQSYLAAMEEVQPDVVLVNGTFYLPWCFLQAARRYGKARVIVHYHGILSKEVAHWKEEEAKQRFLAMEREFTTLTRPTFSHQSTRARLLSRKFFATQSNVRSYSLIQRPNHFSKSQGASANE